MIVFIAPCPRCGQERRWEQRTGDGKSVTPADFSIYCECS